MIWIIGLKNVILEGKKGLKNVYFMPVLVLKNV